MNNKIRINSLKIFLFAHYSAQLREKLFLNLIFRKLVVVELVVVGNIFRLVDTILVILHILVAVRHILVAVRHILVA